MEARHGNPSAFAPMAASGMLPPDADLIANNPSTQLLARTLGLPAPGGRPRDRAGLR